MKSKAILFVNKPKGEPKDSDFKLDEVDVPSLEEGQVLVKNLYLSVDPYMMGKMKGSSTYTSSFELNKPLYGDGLGEVVESKCKDFSKGDIVTSSVMPWIEQCVVDGKKLKKSPEGIDNETLMSICGMPGITAYFGIEKIGEPKKGEIAVVSGAAGAVGHVACQIFKLKGCTVVGIAGGDEKIKFLKELGVDHTIDYKKEDVNQKLKELCPKGINIYWDNVGGTTLDAAVYNMADHARSIQCGSISAYTTEKPPTGPRWEFLLTMRRIRMQGMIVYDWYNEWDRAIKEIASWYNEGKIKKRVTVKEGIKEMPGAFIGLFHGDNVGKLLVKIA